MLLRFQFCNELFKISCTNNKVLNFPAFWENEVLLNALS